MMGSSRDDNNMVGALCEESFLFYPKAESVDFRPASELSCGLSA